MKILIFNFEFPPLGGGGGVATKELAEELASKHEVHIITSWHWGLRWREVTAGVVIHRVPAVPRRQLPTATLGSMVSYIPFALWRGWRLTGGKKFDVINAQFVIPSGIPAALLARWRNVPFVVSFVGGDVYDPTKGMSPHRHPWLKRLIRAVAKQAVAATAISEDTKRRTIDFHQVEVPITVTHLGLVRVKAPAVGREELGLPADGVVLVSIGRLIPRKGYEQLLSAWRNVSQGYLVIIGDGPLLEDLRALVMSYGMTDRVLFTGFVSAERKRQILQVSDGYVSAALHEGFGIVFLEAMDGRLPIVAFAEGGHCDFLIHDRNALLVSSGDQEALARALQNIVSDESLRRRLGDRNIEDVKNFTIDKTSARFERVLEEAIRHENRH